MPYTIIARKYRPQNFDEIIGQEHIVEIIKNALVQQRIAQAYLFSGPRGVGKTSMARILAKSLNCVNGQTLKPCQKCANCIEISQGRSLDCLEIDGASNRGIDEIRALRENVKFSPSSGKFKIYIIDEVHMLTQEAFNALLKTLEEPPEHVKFIFATTQAQKVISTILSRCQRFDFKSVSTLKIIEKLETIAKSENINISKEALFVIAREASGSLRDAETILDQVASLTREKIGLEDINSILGTLEYDFLFSLSDKIVQNDTKGLLKLINDFVQQGKEAMLIFSNLLEHIRNLTLSKFFKDVQASYLDLPADIKNKFIEQARLLSVKRLLNIFDTIIEYQERAKRLDFPQIILEIMAVKLTSEPISSIQHPPALSVIPANHTGNKPHTINMPNENVLGNTNIEKSNETKNLQTIIVEEKTPIEFQTVKEKWDSIIKEISKVKMSLYSYIKEATLLGIDKNTLKLGFPKRLSFNKETLEHKNNSSLLEKILNDYLETSLRIKFEITSNDPIDTAGGLQKPLPQKNPDDSIIRSALSVFNGRLID